MTRRRKREDKMEELKEDEKEEGDRKKLDE